MIESNMVKIFIWEGIPLKVGVLSVLFQGDFAAEIFIKEIERRQKNEEKRTFKYHFGEVGFICFLSPINFLTAFV